MIAPAPQKAPLRAPMQKVFETWSASSSDKPVVKARLVVSVTV